MSDTHGNPRYVKVDDLIEAVNFAFGPIGCGQMVGRHDPKPCRKSGPLCSGCWQRRNRRDETVALIERDYS